MIITEKKVVTSNGILTMNSSTPLTSSQETSIKKTLIGRWQGESFTNNPYAKPSYYSLQFNADGTVEEYSKEGTVIAKGTYRLKGEMIEGTVKNSTVSNEIHGTINVSKYILNGFWQNNPEIMWKVKNKLINLRNYT